MPIEITPEQLVWIVVLMFLIFGVWLAGLTYLMWRAHLRAKRAEEKEAAETPPDRR